MWFNNVYVMLYILLTLLFIASISFTSDRYNFGRGYKVRDLNLTLGGYITTEYYARENYDKFTASDVAVLIYGYPVNRVKYFAEFEFNDVYVKRNSKEDWNFKLDIERLYIDLYLKDIFKLRIGRFITPIGLWNPIHINVLKWTTSDPLTATHFFPRFVTGLQVFGSISSTVSYSVFAQKNRNISEGYNTFISREVYGFEIRKEFSERFKAGINGGWFDIRDPREELTFAGVNSLYVFPKGEISGELMYAIEREKYATPTVRWSYRLSYYIQGIYRIFSKNYAILRYGYFKDKSDGDNYRILTMGWNFRPAYYTAIKAEYQIREKKKLNTFIASFSWMF